LGFLPVSDSISSEPLSFEEQELYKNMDSNTANTKAIFRSIKKSNIITPEIRKPGSTQKPGFG
jgi:hypothetical protein